MCPALMLPCGTQRIWKSSDQRLLTHRQQSYAVSFRQWPPSKELSGRATAPTPQLPNLLTHMFRSNFTKPCRRGPWDHKLAPRILTRLPAISERILSFSIRKWRLQEKRHFKMTACFFLHLESFIDLWADYRMAKRSWIKKMTTS
jgi:hypothetical protein